MIPIKANGIPIEYPEGWAELKFKTYLNIIDTKTDREIVISEGETVMGKTKLDQIKIILSDLGIPNDNAKLEGLPAIMGASQFLETPPQIDPTPTRIGEYEIPQDVIEESVDQYNNMTELIQKVRASGDLTEATEALAYYAAIYVQGFKTEFNPKKANELADKFMDYPCMEVLAVGSFFMRRYLSMESSKPMISLPKNIRMKKMRPGFVNFRKTLGHMLHWTASRDM